MRIVHNLRTFLMIFWVVLPVLLTAQRSLPFPTNSPEQEGVSSAAILSFIERLEQEVDAVHSFMILRHGKQISKGWWAPYNAETPHVMHSLSKSFTATAIGLAIDEGRLTLDDQVISFFPGEIPPDTSWQLKAMRIRDLITMNTGHQEEPRLWMAQDSWVKTFLHAKVPFKPGTHFLYNSAATYMLSAIVQKVTGEKLVDYLDSRLFIPLGINKPDWDLSPEGINTGGWGLHITTEDIVKLGQLYLQKAMWHGKRILSGGWVDQATSKQTSSGSNPDNDWEQGYGFQFWRCRHNCYRGDGAFGQFCIVIPEHDAVLAITSGVYDMAAVMNTVWETLLPAMQPSPLEVDPEASAALQQKLKDLTLPLVQGETTSPFSEKLHQQTFQLSDNEAGVKSVLFDLNGEEHRITIEMQGGKETLQIGTDKHLIGKMNGLLPYTGSMRSLTGTSGAWTNPDEYQVKIYFYETPGSIVYTFHFSDNGMTWKSELRHALFGPREELAVLKGKAEVMID